MKLLFCNSICSRNRLKRLKWCRLRHTSEPRSAPSTQSAPRTETISMLLRLETTNSAFIDDCRPTCIQAAIDVTTQTMDCLYCIIRTRKIHFHLHNVSNSLSKIRARTHRREKASIRHSSSTTSTIELHVFVLLMKTHGDKLSVFLISYIYGSTAPHL